MDTKTGTARAYIRVASAPRLRGHWATSHARLPSFGAGVLQHAASRRRLVKSHLQAVAVCAGLLTAPAPLDRLQLDALHIVHIKIVQLSEVRNGRSYGRGLL
eukprot:10935799-Alexandrium_andersonii.AAC.1